MIDIILNFLPVLIDSKITLFTMDHLLHCNIPFSNYIEMIWKSVGFVDHHCVGPKMPGHVIADVLKSQLHTHLAECTAKDLDSYLAYTEAVKYKHFPDYTHSMLDPSVLHPSSALETSQFRDLSDVIPRR